MGELSVEAGADGELEVRWGAPGSVLAGFGEALATAVSVAVRSGVPPVHLVEKLLHTRFVPAGATGDPRVPHATSVADHLARRIAQEWLTPAERASLGLESLGWEKGVLQRV
ncbi:TSCPD domain-containing protein [Actinocorallia lasiicapitis]